MDDNIYRAIVYTHILAAMAWVGGAFFIQLLGIRTARSTDPQDLPKLGRQIEWFGMRYFLPVSIVTFVAGVILVSPALAVQPVVDLAGDAVLARIGDHRRAVHRPAFEEGRRDVRDPWRDGTRGSRGVRPTLPGVAHRSCPVLRDRRAHGVEAGRRQLTSRLAAS